jgi:antitoxin (DNA-binding transcriptional repressor) of toxin-antitoxin stability system
MHKVDLKEATTHLAELIEEAASGEEVVITQDDGSSFQIVPLRGTKPRPRFGSAKGLIKMSEDFDEPLEDFKDYVP